MMKYPWLHYSQFCDGVFCRACALFAPSVVGGHDPGQFVTSPFKAWVKMTLKACAHAKKEYHLKSMATMTEFIARYEQPSQSVGTLLDSEAQRVMERNHKVIGSLFKVTILCGQQGMALRGHRDDRI